MSAATRDLPVAAIAAALVPKALSLVAALGIAGRQVGHEFIALKKAQGGIGDSFAVAVSGPKAGRFFHNAAGTGGDLVALIRYMRGGSWGDAVGYAKDFLGAAPTQRAAPPRPVAAAALSTSTVAKRKRAETIWRGTVPLAGTVGEQYLTRTRGVRADAPNLRFAPRCWHDFERRNFPAVIARVEAADGTFLGVWRIYLDAATCGKAPIELPRVGLGAVAGGSVRLGRDNGARVDVAEGVETALGVQGRYPDLDMRAVLSTGGMRGFAWGPGLAELVIWADADPPDPREFLFIVAEGRRVRRSNPNYRRRPGIEAANALAFRARRAGLRTAIVAPGIEGRDFNDLYRETP